MNIEVVPCTHAGCVDIRDPRQPRETTLHLGPGEWLEFVEAVKAGKYDHLAGDPSE